MKLIYHLSKIDINSLLKFLNNRTVEVLKHLGYLEKITSPKISKIIIKSYSEQKILSIKKIRNSLFDTFTKSEIELLSKTISKPERKNYYTYLKNLSFKKNSKEMNLLKNYFEIEEIKIKEDNEVKTEKVEINLKIHENSHVKPLYPLFDHQIKASYEAIELLESKKPRAFLHMPTGSGKTRTAVNIMSMLLRKKTDNFCMIWLANKEELCDQAMNEFYKSWQILGNQQIKIVKHFGGVRSNLKNINNELEEKPMVIFSSLGMIWEDVTSNISSIIELSKKTSLVIMDEAHLSTAKTYKTIIELLAPTNKTAILGLSATPGRTYRDVNQDIELKDFYYSQKISLKIKNEKNIINWLIKNEYLAKASIEKINFESDLVKLFTKKEVENELIRIKDGKDYSKNFLKKLSNDNERIEFLINIIIEESKKNQKMIVFASSKDNAIAISDLLNIKGIKAASITNETDINLRRQSIIDYKNEKNNLNILVNYDVLTTGFDAPKTKIAIIARPTTSIVLYHQMIGRAVRGKKQGGNKSCKILTVADTYLPGYKDLADSFYFWEDIWND
jgi:DNA repair protein RadD